MEKHNLTFLGICNGNNIHQLHVKSVQRHQNAPTHQCPPPGYTTAFGVEKCVFTSFGYGGPKIHFKINKCIGYINNEIQTNENKFILVIKKGYFKFTFIYTYIYLCRYVFTFFYIYLFLCRRHKEM